MNNYNYSVASFLHVISALGFFVTLGLEWTSLRHLRRATTSGQVLEWMRLPAEMGQLGMISMLTLLATGFYMMAIAWGAVGWIIVALGAIVLMILLSMILTRQRMAVIGKTASIERGPVSPALSHLLHDSVLTVSLQTRVAMAVGIVFLMTVKPGLDGSLLTIVVAIILGLASTLPMTRRAQVHEGQGD